jgi:hypothetical protein
MNKLKLLLPVLFALVLCMGMAKAITVPPGIVTYVPITFTNRQSAPVVANTPLSFVFNALKYQQYETSTLNNTEIFFANGTIAKSWLEGNYFNEIQKTNTLYTSNSVLYWFLTPSTYSWIGANTGTPLTNTIYLGFGGNTPNSGNTLWSSIDGVAPQLTCSNPASPPTCGKGNQVSGIYGQYDNGANVFRFYDNFKGSVLNTKLWNETGNITVANGIYLSASATFSNINSINTYNAINITDFLYNNYHKATTQIDAWSFGYGGADIYLNSLFLSGNMNLPPEYLQGIVGSSVYINGNWCKPPTPGGIFPKGYGVYSLYSTTTGRSSILALNYSTVCTATADVYYGNNSPYAIQDNIPLNGGNSGVPINGTWVRIRTPPPDDIMPSTSFASLDGAPPVTGPTVSVSGTTAADVGQPMKLSATSGFISYQWYNDTGATPAAITGATTNAYNATAGATGTFDYYVIVTDSNGTIKSSPDSKIIVSAVADLGPAPVNLGSAGNFVILAESGITTTGTTSIVGNIGVSPISGAAMTGFGLSLDPSGQFATSPLVTGNVYAADYSAPTPAIMTAAVSDMQTAYADAAGRVDPSNTDLDAGNIGGLILYPGLYMWSTAVTIPTNVTLNCQGNTKSVFIFQIAGGLNTGSGATVNLSGGCQPQNIFWQVAGGVTFGATSSFKGIILSQTAIVMGAGDVLNGRALAQTAVTLNADNVTAPAAKINQQPTITLSASTPTTINATQNVTFTNVTTPGTPPYTYSYNVTGGNGFTINGNKITFNAAGNYTVNETVIDSAGANSTSNNIPISVNPEFTVSISVANQTIIAGNSTILTATAVNGSSPYTYQWYNGTLCDNATLIAGANTSIYLTPILTSTASYCVVATDSLDANAISTAMVTVAAPVTPPAPSVTAYINGTESGWQITNLTKSSSEMLSLSNQTIQLTVDSITPSGAGITVNNQTYSLAPGSPTALTNIINSTDVVVLENLNYTPVSPTITLLMYETSTLNATAQRQPASTATPANSAIAVLASITTSGKWYIAAAIIVIIALAIMVIILFSARRSRRIKTHKAKPKAKKQTGKAK